MVQKKTKKKNEKRKKLICGLFNLSDVDSNKSAALKKSSSLLQKFFADCRKAQSAGDQGYQPQKTDADSTAPGTLNVNNYELGQHIGNRQCRRYK